MRSKDSSKENVASKQIIAEIFAEVEGDASDAEAGLGVFTRRELLKLGLASRSQGRIHR